MFPFTLSKPNKALNCSTKVGQFTCVHAYLLRTFMHRAQACLIGYNQGRRLCWGYLGLQPHLRPLDPGATGREHLNFGRLDGTRSVEIEQLNVWRKKKEKCG